MEGHEKERDESREERPERTGERLDAYPVRSLGERADVEGGRILEEFEKKRQEGRTEYIRCILEGIVFRMGIDAEVVGAETGEEIRLYVKGNNTGVLIGKHGRTLDAVQYLLTKIYQRRFGEGRRIVLDAEEYRKRRAEALENLAFRLGEKVKRKRRPMVAGVFNPRDRRIIHMALREDELLETESRGDGYYKKLLIRPRREGLERDRGD
ncbi:MAG: KH domain-containing protein [Deltaproteobacteria bacterium]|nr:KH domain-containing protein [Deltaproteobacteria bacterium]MBW2121576.1 KH domain-containing protein [Deltaproteobacteria bacterium]